MHLVNLHTTPPTLSPSNTELETALQLNPLTAPTLSLPSRPLLSPMAAIDSGEGAQARMATEPDEGKQTMAFLLADTDLGVRLDTI